jgi:hypothetical protein
MATPTPKNDWARQMRATKDAARKLKTVSVPSVDEKMAAAKAALSTVKRKGKAK